MASLRHDIRIAKPVEAVWTVVCDSTRLAEWFEGIDSVTVEGDRRTLDLSVGITIVERIVTNDSDLHRFQYAIIEGLPDAAHLGTIDVLEDGPSATRVVYGTDVADPMAPILDQSVLAGLKGLKALLEG